MVTLKQHYEKSLQQSQFQLQAEQNQCLSLRVELKKKESEIQEVKSFYEDELSALREQLVALKNLLKNQRSAGESPFDKDKYLRSEFLQQAIPSPFGRIEEFEEEKNQLREAFEIGQKRQIALELELASSQEKARAEINQLRQCLEEERREREELADPDISKNASVQLRKELELIKQTLMQGAQETKALEIRYVELLNGKIGLEHHSKQLQIQIEHQSSNLSAFQLQIHEIEKQKKALEASLQCKEIELSTSQEHFQDSQKRIQHLTGLLSEKEFIQDKYEELKDECKRLDGRLEEEIEMRTKSESFLAEIEAIAANQETQLQELMQQLQNLQDEKHHIEEERDQIKALLEECENQLRVAQQHLAKKMKESALLNEKLSEQQNYSFDNQNLVEQQKIELVQLRANIEFYQKQEKRLHDQLNEAFKGNEAQASKWEEKYFAMHEKWQESENRNRELKKFEEKHLQMQSLLTNLGSFMGTSFHPSKSIFTGEGELVEKPTRHLTAESSSFEDESFERNSPFEERYDLFGLRMQDKSLPPRTFS